MLKESPIKLEITAVSDHQGPLQKEGRLGVAAFAETERSLLVGQLQHAEGRLEAPDEHKLDIFFLDGRIELEKKLEEQVLVEKIIQAQDVDPGGLLLRVGVEDQAVQVIFQ